MASGQKYTLTFDAQLDISQMKGALGNIQGELNKLQLPQNVSKNLLGSFQKLSDEVNNFERIINGGLNSKNDLTKLEASANKILGLYGKLQNQVQSLASSSSSQLEKLFPESVAKNIEAARDAFATYQKSVKDATQELNKASQALDRVQEKIDAEKGKAVISPEQFKELGNNLNQAQSAVTEYEAKLKEAQQTVENLEASLKQPSKSSRYREAAKDVEEYAAKLKEANNKLAELATQKIQSTTAEKQATELAKLQIEYDKAAAKAEEFKNKLDAIQSVSDGSGLQQLLTIIGNITGLDMSKFSADAEGAAEALRTYLNTELQNLVSNLQSAQQATDKAGNQVQEFGKHVEDTADAGRRFDDQMREVGQLKSRIQYFFGLANSINLVKRAIRGAFDTIKELDKAMTETAVVTDFSVNDMWSQLPEYTKRANELGVTTLAAYEAATLYYQQGLKANEVNALSTETLKMARIAGLDAAEATDRMTNALRGFNMELTAASAQRVDDVYSELAANTASNVDEISTAMTKVASLANNANMEFETTAAFLAQIIETTRESAETAGTALKTVIARFSEVKKLIDEGSLKGQDEEGQLIDVNKVQAALRTANIDMSKYFLGEVGLDDIFMELASKWDSLTTMQQRYIATQAAGSRQQSRFIAMMSDYARTQELVGKAYNANGAAARQFEKTQESLESKLARLKNAWNEFLMGLTNNVIVKTAVDTLTMLLNAVNKVTGAFGEGAGFILKWLTAIMAFKGLKVLFSSGGLVEKGLLGLTGGTALGDKLGEILGKGASTGGVKLGEALFGGIKKAGQNVWASSELFGELLSKGKLAGTAAGITGLATALLAVAAAAMAAVAAYNLWLKHTDKGHIKLAEDYAEAMHKTANSLQDQANRAKEAKQKIEDYTNSINNAETPKQRNEAILAQNEYITSLLKEDATYAQYIQQLTSRDGQIYLTLDSAKLAAAVDKIAEGALKASGLSDIADAQVAHAQEEYYNHLLTNVDLNAGTFRNETRDLSASDLMQFPWWQRLGWGPGDYNEANYETASTTTPVAIPKIRNLTEAEKAFYTQIQAQATAAQIERQTYLASAGTKFTNLYAPEANLSASQASLVASAFGKSFNLSETAQQLIEEYSTVLQNQTRESLISQYKNVFGYAPDEGAATKDLSRTLAQQQAYDFEAGQQTQGLADLVQTDAGKLILEVFTGAFEGAASDISRGKLWEAYSSLNINQQDLVKNLLGVDDSSLMQALSKLGSDFAKGIDENFIGTLSKSTSFTEKQLANVSKQLTLGQRKQITKIAENFSGYGQKITDTIVSSAFNNALAETPDQGTTDFIEQLNNLSDNPVLLLQAVEKAASEAEGPVKELATSLSDDFKNNPAFSKSSQLQFFLTSDEFEKLNEQIDKFVEANGLITSTNINELAESSTTLTGLLDNNVVSAEGLANILNSYQKGSIGIFDLNDSLIDLYNGFYDVENAAEAAYAVINNFEFGHDYTEAYEFIQQAVDKLKELQKTGQYGSMEKYLSVFFTDLPKGVEEIDKAITLLEKLQGTNGGDFWTDLFGLKYTKQNGQKTFDFQPIIDDFLSDESATNFKEYVQQRFKEKYGYDITDDFVNLLIQNLQSHDTDGTIKNIASAQIQKAINAYISGLTGEGIKVDKEAIKQRIAMIAKMYNLDPAELLREYLANNGKENGNGFTLEGLQFTEEDYDFSGIEAVATNLETAINSALADHKITLDQLEIDPNLDPQEIASQVKAIDISQLLQALGTDENGRFDLGTAYANIKEIVPEVGDGTLTPQQWVESQLGGEPLKLKVTFDYMEQDEDGVYKSKTMPVDIEVGDTTQLEETIAQITSQAPNLVDTLGVNSAKDVLGEISTALTTITTGHFSVPLDQQKLTAANSAAAALQSKLDFITGKTYEANVKVTAQQTELKVSGEGQTIVFTISTAAKGGIVKSFGSGGRSIEPGLALTGELAPEIIWNAEKGYAYLAGKNGPEINNLQPGDRVFNGEETKAILKRSGISSFANGGQIKSCANPWGSDGDGDGKGKGKDKDKDKDKKKTDWKNELDWLYNLVQDIAEYERKASLFSLKYESYLHDSTKTGKDLYKMLQKQLQNLEKAQQGYNEEQKKRETELSRLNKAAKKDKVSQYVKYNSKDNTVEIDWDKINKLKKGSEKDKETYDKIVEYINKMEEAKSRRDQAEEAVLEIEEQMRELREQIAERYVDFEQRVFDALTASQQSNIDSLSELNDSLNDLNDSILDSIRKEIELQRQIRDNTKTESEIADMEVQLAFLRRDTTGANRAQILELEQQLKEAREEYSDSLLDQSIDRLEESNELARLQREKQIELLQHQLDYEKDNGALWEEVHRLISSAYDSNGKFKVDSELGRLLKETDAWGAMSQAQRDAWATELVEQAKEIYVYLTEHPPVAEKPTVTQPGTTIQGTTPTLLDVYQERFKAEKQVREQLIAEFTNEALYRTGRPILESWQWSLINQQAAEAGRKAAERAEAYNRHLTQQNVKSNSFDININVEKIDSDYSVDQMVDRVKNDIYNSAIYRNVNNLTLLR